MMVQPLLNCPLQRILRAGKPIPEYPSIFMPVHNYTVIQLL